MGLQTVLAPTENLFFAFSALAIDTHTIDSLQWLAVFLFLFVNCFVLLIVVLKFYLLLQNILGWPENASTKKHVNL